MENKNVAPTMQELENAGFTIEPSFLSSDNLCYFRNIVSNLYISCYVDSGYVKVSSEGFVFKKIPFTKEAIEKEFVHFEQPLPEWNKTRRYNWDIVLIENKNRHERAKLPTLDNEFPPEWTDDYFTNVWNLKSAIAYAKLVEIMWHINQKFPSTSDTKPFEWYCIDRYLNIKKIDIRSKKGKYVVLLLASKKGAEMLLRDNNELIHEFYKI